MNFENNIASYGGGLFSDLSNNIKLDSIIFLNNLASNNSGGAICFK
jgi:predicted outer membrane repeat protein